MSLVRKAVIKLKGAMGFCQCDKCWSRSSIKLKADRINIERNICDFHIECMTREVFIDRAIEGLKWNG